MIELPFGTNKTDVKWGILGAIGFPLIMFLFVGVLPWFFPNSQIWAQALAPVDVLFYVVCLPPIFICFLIGQPTSIMAISLVLLWTSGLGFVIGSAVSRRNMW